MEHTPNAKNIKDGFINLGSRGPEELEWPTLRALENLNKTWP